MRIGVLGTGRVGRALAERFDGLGHEGAVGTRDVATTLARAEPDAMGNPPFSSCARAHTRVRVAPFTARGPEMILPLWLRLWNALGTPMFGFKIVR